MASAAAMAVVMWQQQQYAQCEGCIFLSVPVVFPSGGSLVAAVELLPIDSCSCAMVHLFTTKSAPPVGTDCH